MDGIMDEKIAQIDKGKMRRVLGVLDLFAIGYGDLGSSIYYALGITVFFALGAAPLALLLAGLVFVCTALTYAEMSSVIHEAGGSAAFARTTFNDLVSFIAGWGLLLDYIVTIAISAYAVAPYLAYFLPILKSVGPKIIFTIILVFLLVLLNIRGSKHSTRLSLILTILTLLTQLVIIVIAGVMLVHFQEFFKHLKIGGADKMWSPSWGDFWRGVAMAMVAYTGIESMSQLSSEAKDPSKTVPKAIVIAMGTLLVAYVGIALVALSALTPQVLSTTYLEDPIAGIVSVLPVGSRILGPWVGILAAILLIVAANAGLIGASRLSFSMGEHFQLPRFFYRLHKKYRTPYVSLIVFALLASFIVVWSFGSLAFLADLYNFGAMLGFFCAHLSLIFHRIHFPDIERPFMIPLNIKFKNYRIPVTAIIGLIATFSVFVLIVITKPDGRLLGTGWVVMGLVLYFSYRSRYKISPVGQLGIQKISISDYKEIEIKKILLPTRGHLATDTVLIGCDLAKLFNAELTIIHIVDISYMLPINTPLLQRETYSESVLNRAQAIAIEKGIKADLRTIRARSVVKTIQDIAESENFDLLIIGARKPSALGPITEKILQTVNCRVWVCRSDAKDQTEKMTSNLFHRAPPLEDPESL